MPWSYQNPEDLNDLNIDVQVAWEILVMDPSPAVALTVLNRTFELSHQQLATALKVDADHVRRWMDGEPLSAAETTQLFEMTAVATYLLRFETFLTPAAVGRWMSMPRQASGGRKTTSALKQLAAGRFTDVTADADALLSGTFVHRRLPPDDPKPQTT